MQKNNFKETYASHKVENLEMNIYHNSVDSPYHWHDECEFIYVTRGTCECIIDGVSYTLSENEATLVQSGELHAINLGRNSLSVAIVIHPHICGSDCMRFFSDNSFNKIFRGEKNMSESRIISNLKEMDECFSKKTYAYELRLKALVSDTFSTIIENSLFSKGIKPKDDSIEVFEEIIRYVHKNFQEKITLAKIASRSNYSKSYIIKLFKKHTGKTPTDYINRYKIYKSEELLKNTNYSVLDISNECGFENIGYFIRLFKKHHGVPPGKWRNELTMYETI